MTTIRNDELDDDDIKKDLPYLIKSVPMSTLHDITLSEEFVEPAFKYAELCNYLRNDVQDNDKVLIRLGSYGGSTQSSTAIVNAMKACKGLISVSIEAPSYSAACDIALAADFLVLQPYTFLMFHNFSDSARGKGNELKTGVINTDRLSASLTKDLYSPFLTKGEISDILNDKDIYVHWDDKDLQERVQRHFGDKPEVEE
jgi:ATP-dependent protease ClpP protease subunit